MCPGECLVIFGDVFGCQKKGLGAVGIQWVEAMGAAKHPTIDRTDTSPPKKGIIWAKITIAPKLRRHALEVGFC